MASENASRSSILEPSLTVCPTLTVAIHSGELAKATYENYGVFNFAIPTACTGVPAQVLDPKKSWQDKAAFDKTLAKLAGLFQNNFKAYADKSSKEILSAAPVV